MSGGKRRSRGEGSIYFDHTKGMWVGSISQGFTAAGNRRRRKVYGKTKTEVRERLGSLRQEIESGVKTPARLTVTDVARKWLEVGLMNQHAHTIQRLRIVVERHIVPQIGGIRVRDLTPDDVDEWLRGRSKVLATRSLRDLLGVLRRVLRFGQRRGLVTRNVAELVTAPLGRQGRVSKALTLEQARALLQAAEGSRLYAYFAVSLMTGMRTEEARALTWAHVQLDAVDGLPPHVRVWRSVRAGGEVKTRQSRRTLRLPEPAVVVLRAHRARQMADRLAAGPLWHESDLVFCSSVGTPLHAANVRRELRRICARAGLEGRWAPRELRHTFVSLLSSDGVPLEAIARLVGHAGTRTTELVYRRELRPVLVEGAESITRLLGS